MSSASDALSHVPCRFCGWDEFSLTSSGQVICANDDCHALAGAYSDAGTKPASQSLTEEILRRAVTDVMLLRRELSRHDLSGSERAALLAAAMPALIQLEVQG